MHFVAITLQLRSGYPHTPLDAGGGVFAHAAFVNAISTQDVGLGRALHDMRRHKRMTLAIIGSNTQEATLRLTFMTQHGLACANALMNALAASSTLRLGQTVFDIEGVDLNDPEWGGISTWADFARERTYRRMHFSFATPTAVTKQDDSGFRFMELFPQPMTVFAGLARRWQGLDGPRLPDDLYDFLMTGGCVVNDFRGHPITFRTPERTQKGFVGWVDYECLKDEPAYVSALNSLARFAFFAGIGYQTARGMYAVKTTFTD